MSIGDKVTLTCKGEPPGPIHTFPEEKPVKAVGPIDFEITHQGHWVPWETLEVHYSVFDKNNKPKGDSDVVTVKIV